MDVEQTTTSTPPDPATPPAPPVEVTGPTSMAEHAAQFDPDKRQDAPEAEKTPPRMRSAKQNATPEDVPRINELTRKWREEERQRKALEQELATLRSQRTTPPPPSTPTAPATKPEPKLEDFGQAEDPYAEWLLARGEWRAEQRQAAREAERQQQEQQTAAQQASTQREEARRALEAKVATRIQEFIKTTPDYFEAIDTLKDESVPDLLMAALTDNDGDKFPEYVYNLAKHPDIRLELHLLTDGKPVTPALVAQTRRLLDSRLTPAGTGAGVTAQPPVTAPRPPTPVRTGPMKAGDEFPGEVGSIAEHARAYSPTRRR